MDNKLPDWYMSTSGLKISATVKGMAGAFIPILKSILGIEIGSDAIDAVIDAVIFLAFAAYALYGYVRAKRILGARIESLGAEVRRLGGTPDM